MDRTTHLDNTGKASVLDRIVEVVTDPARCNELDGALRALTHPLLDTVVTRRHEDIEPIEETLAFAAGQVSADLDDRTLAESSIYSVGWIDALLDICAVGIDRGISTALVEQAGRRLHVRDILVALFARGPLNASALADAVGVSPNQLSNLLRWMEPSDLVRRAIAGRSKLVSLGPKGEAVYLALLDEVSNDLPEEGEQRNLVLVRRMAKKGGLASWLLRGFGEGHFAPVSFDVGLMPVDGMKSLFQDLPAADREGFKAAIVEAAGEWRPADGLQAIQDLAALALHTGAIGVVRAIRGHIEQEHVTPRSPEGRRVLAALIAVLGGFQATEPARDTLRQFFWDERFHPELTADLFVALCRCEPASYPLYLPRLLRPGEHKAADGELGGLQRTLATFVRLVGWDTVCRHMHELPRESMREFLRIVGWGRVVAGLEGASRDALEAFIVRGLTWALVAETIPTLDAPSRGRLIGLLRHQKLARPILREDGTFIIEPIGEELPPYVYALLEHKLVTQTLYQTTVEELYRRVDSLS
jgi:DNA-binding MarR family transcriptional regulator